MYCTPAVSWDSLYNNKKRNLGTKRASFLIAFVMTAYPGRMILRLWSLESVKFEVVQKRQLTDFGALYICEMVGQVMSISE